MRIALIAAMDKNRVIGCGNTIPWHLPADTAYFRKVTMGHPVIMGRHTHESIGRPLPARTNIVLTSQDAIAGCIVAHSLEGALAEAAKSDIECFIIGGGAVYAEALPLADRIYLTEIDVEVDGDTFFPEFDNREWLERSREHHLADEQNAYAMDFVVYERAAKHA